MLRNISKINILYPKIYIKSSLGYHILYIYNYLLNIPPECLGLLFEAAITVFEVSGNNTLLLALWEINKWKYLNS